MAQRDAKAKPTLVEKFVKESEERLDALKPSVDEFKEVQEALQAIKGGDTPEAAKPPEGRRGPGRPKGSTNKSTATTAAPRRRRKRKGGTRADQAVKLIEENPGISATGLAERLQIKPNYLYRVLGDLEAEGRIIKDPENKTYSPAAAA